MSKFTINNPAFLSIAGNVRSFSGAGIFYLEAIEDETSILFSYPSSTKISLDGSTFMDAPENITINNGEKVYMTFDVITDFSFEKNSLWSIEKEYNVGGICPFIDIIFYEDEVEYTLSAAPFFSGTKIRDAKNLIIDITGTSLALTPNFENCTSLISPPQLPAISVYKSGYQNMFNGCTSLSEAPELPATELANYCYSGMFNGCTSLSNAPELHATVLYDSCYAEMFRDCTSLLKAPELPATVLAKNCYQQMFNGCTSLSEAPELPATELANTCYSGMFNGCTSLSEAPELPALHIPSLAYQNMFNGCTSLSESSIIYALSMDNNAIDGMFEGCINIAKITCLVKKDTVIVTSKFAYGVAEQGLFIKNKDASWDTGSNGIPEGWTVQDYAG